jgi:hypothetical protein
MRCTEKCRRVRSSDGNHTAIGTFDEVT